MGIEDFKGTQPVFLPEEFFDGQLEGWAVMESPIGGLQRRATIEAAGKFDLVTRSIRFNETYRFDDGHVDTLNWVITKIADGKYEGRAPTVEEAANGEQAGCAFHWSYTRDTPQKDGGSTKLNFDDWFYLIDKNVCIVRGSLGRLGIPFATAHVTYRKIRS